MNYKNILIPLINVSCLSKDNENYIEHIYNLFLSNPNSIDILWKNFFLDICNKKKKMIMYITPVIILMTQNILLIIMKK